MKDLIVLRPEPAAGATTARACAMGMKARAIPLFEIRSLKWTAPDPGGFDAILLTSANAIRHGGDQLARLKCLPVHAVGAASAAAARAAGFAVASVGERGAGDMAPPPATRLLHLAGREHVAIGAAQTIPVYEARAVDHPAGLEALEDCVLAVHSPRAGRRLAELVRERSRLAIAAISAAAAGACGPGWQRVEAASQPNDEALLALAARLCESRRP